MRPIERSSALRRAQLAACLLCLLAAPAAAGAAADAPPLVLEHLTRQDGLPQGTVMTTLQDSQGFVWLGTEDGLVRYDGHQLYRYARSRKKPGSLPGNYVWKVVEDKDGNLWVALNDAGVAKWDRRSNRFTSYRHDPKDLDSVASDRVRTVLIDRRGRVWIGTFDAGVDVLDPSTGRIRHLRHDADDPASLASNHVSALALDRSGDVWIGTDEGLDRWRADTRTLVRAGPPPGKPHSLSDKQISCVLEDRSGTFWIGTFDAGLIHMTRAGRVLATFRHDEQNASSLAADDVRALLEDRSGRFWVGTADGLDRLDRATGAFTHYRHDANDGASLRDSFVMSLYQDRDGLIWIGTRSGGVSRFDPRSWELGGHRPEWLENQPVTAFADAPGGRVWIASLSGLFRFDTATGTATPLGALLGRRDAIGDERIMSLRRDRRGSLWIGTQHSGLKRLGRDGRIESIPAQPGDRHSLSAAGIMTIFQARSGAIWIGTFGGGADILDPATHTVRQLPFGAAAGEVSAPNVTAIVEDLQGNFWLGTDGGGLDLARADGTVLKVFRNDPADASTLPSNTVYALAVDGDGRVWAGTAGGGLARVADPAAPPEKIEFQTLSRADGLSSDTVYGIVPDSRGLLWLSGNAGLMRLDPATGAVKTYHREHGAQGEEFSFGAYFRLPDGRICFGGPGGFNIFDPAELSQRTRPPRLVLTGMSVLGVPVEDGTPAWLRHRIDLDYRDAIVSLDFGVLDFASPKHNRLAYRMAGLTNDWIDLGAQRRITLTNLDPGSHVLEVRAANADSVWSTTPFRLTIHRDPAPWASPWAYALYALALFGLVAQQLHRHRRKFREMAAARERLESEVQLRTRELVESNRQLAEAAQAKSDFLDRMSHELRTPMNGVVGMAELLSRTALSATQARLTKTIRSSAQLLLQIVNDLLDLSRVRAGKVELEELPLDFGEILEECTSLFAGAAEAKGIDLVVRPPAAGGETLLGDPLRIRQILMNLVGNAVKFTEQGEVAVAASIERAGAERAVLRLSVADTGIGMDEAATSKIFEPFAQADEATTRRFGGTGLGLAICRELADLMGGRIGVASEPGVGSTFEVTLPLKLGSATQWTRAAGAARASDAGTPLEGHVLLVEDEPVNAAVAEGYLEACGCTSVWVDSGTEAVARIAAERFDLILMDLSMPGMDGFAATQLIRRQAAGAAAERADARIPIVALTAHDAERYRDKCLAADFDDILSKPYTLDDCRRLLRRWLARGGEEGTARAGTPAGGAADAAAEGGGLARVDPQAVAALHEMHAGRRTDLYTKLVELFRSSSAQSLDELESALAGDDLAAAAAVCHKLASAAANVGALAYAERVKTLERHARAGESAPARTLCAALRAAHAPLLEALQSQRLAAIA